MRSVHPAAFALLLLTPVALGLAGCGEENPPPPRLHDAGGSASDSGVPDAGGSDAGTPDGGSLDAGMTDGGATSDGGPTVDGGSSDGATGTDAGPPPDGGAGPGCALRESQRLGMDDPEAFAVSAGSALHVAWTERRAGSRDLFLKRFGDTDPEINLTATDPGLIRGAAVAPVAGGVVAAYYSNTSGSFELYSVPVDDDGTVDESVQLTDNSVREESPTLLAVTSSRALLGWLETNDATGGAVTRAARTRFLSAAATPDGDGASVSTPPQSPNGVSLTALGSAYAAAWADDGHAYLQPLTSAGETFGLPIQLDQEGVVNSGVSIAGGAAGGAAIFSALVGGTGRRMYFRPLDDEGMPTGTSVLISDSTEPASDPSVVRFLGGYAVIYQVSNGATGDAETRIRLLDSLGNRIDRIDLGASSATAPPPVIALAGSRELFVAWSSATVGLHAGRVTCE